MRKFVFFTIVVSVVGLDSPMCVHIKKINRCSIHGVFAAGELQAHDLRVRVAGAEASDHLAGQELRPLV